MSRHASYLIASIVVWAGIILSSAIVLDGGAFGDMLPILAGGAVFYLVILPAALFARDRR